MDFAEFDRRIWGLMREVSDSMTALFRPAGERYGLTPQQMHLLLEMHRSGSHTVGSLGRSIGVAGANVSSACKRLERQGLLMRERDPRDERVVRLALTPAGLEAVSYVEEALKHGFASILEAHPQDMRAVLEGLERFSQLLKLAGAPDKEES